MKKLGIFAVLLSVAMFVGCGEGKKPAEQKPAEEPAVTTPADAAPADDATVAPDKDAAPAKPVADVEDDGLGGLDL